MPRTYHFTKLHGLGNDYLYFDAREGGPWPDWSAFARAISDRHFGVGADGIIVIEPSTTAEVRMRIFNADGSESEMCGNGLRALAKWLYDRGWAGTRQLIETGAGLLAPEIVETEGGKATRIRVNMGPPRFRRKDIGMLGDPDAEALDEAVTVDGRRFSLTCASMGNPHAMIFGPLMDEATLAHYGSRIETDPLFPRRVNVHSVEVRDPGHIRMRHWERGAGLTLACGTGVAATLAAAHYTGRTGPRVEVEVPGGILEAEWENPPTGPIYLTGPAVEVFSGTYEWPDDV
ncbi:MAG: diaminopimelate epimerase [Sulfobacillus sp.]|nr:diaminopimelate epimerase [Sulfobacillus sp.]